MRKERGRKHVRRQLFIAILYFFQYDILCNVTPNIADICQLSSTKTHGADGN